MGLSRDASWADGNEKKDLLLITLKYKYGGYNFPWSMFLPAITGKE